jgi:hypothetical protein
MPDAGFFGALLGGFNQASAANRQVARDDEDRQSERESKILGSLIQSDDPEISAAALSAMAEIAGGAKRPKGGYLQRIVGGGDTAVHPAVAHVLNLLHTPGPLDVSLGRAQARGGVTPVSPRPSGGAEGPSGAPPAVTPPAPGAPPQQGSAAVPAGPMTAGGPPSVSALGSPGGPPRAQPAGLAPAADSGGPSEPTRTAAPPPMDNTPPQAATAVRATSAPAITQPGMGGVTMGGPPQITPGGPVQGQMDPTFARTVFLPPEEQQRRANLRHAEGIELDLNSKVNASLKLWDTQHPSASPEDRQTAHDQILEKELGTAPKWTGIAGTVTRDRLPPGTVDVTGAPILPGSGPATDRFVLQQAGSRIRAVPTTASASSTNTLNSDAQLSRELFGKDLTGLDPTQMAALAKERDRRAVNLAGQKATVQDTAQTKALSDRWQPVSMMDSTGLIHGGEQNGVGALRQAGTNQPAPSDWIKVPSSSALPHNIGASGKSVIQGINVMQVVNQRLMKLIEDAGLQDDNSPLNVRWDNFLYGLGVDPGDLNGMPFAEYAQLGGTSEAYGLNGLIRGRPNQSLQEIYQRHLVGANNTPALVYKKLQELENTIIPTVKSSVLDAEQTRLAPNTQGGTRPGAAAKQAQPEIVEQGGVKYEITRDAAGNIVSSKRVGTVR